MSNLMTVNTRKPDMQKLITQEEAVERLRLLCEEAGGIGVFADRVGVTISAVSHQLHSNRPIQGKVAEYMGITVQRKTTITYKKAPK